MTDKEKIRAEIERLKESGCASPIVICDTLLAFIDSMQEKPVSTDILRKASEEYLKVLSETPYNNTPVTNAQTVVKELVNYLDNPSEYYPDHITEPVSEDMEAEFLRAAHNLREQPTLSAWFRHFYNLGKQQIMKGFPTWKRSGKLIEGALLDRGILYIPRYMIELSELKKLPKEE